MEDSPKRLSRVWNAVLDNNAPELENALAQGHDPDEPLTYGVEELSAGVRNEGSGSFRVTPLQATLILKRFDLARLLLENGVRTNSIIPGCLQEKGKCLFVETTDRDNTYRDLVSKIKSFTQHFGPRCTSELEIDFLTTALFYCDDPANEDQRRVFAAVALTHCDQMYFWRDMSRNFHILTELRKEQPTLNISIAQMTTYTRFKNERYLPRKEGGTTMPVFQLMHMEYAPSLLWNALRHGIQEEAKALVFYGAPTSVRNDDGDYPIHCVQNADTLRFFLQHGVDANAEDANKRTPLHRFVYKGSEDLVDVLLQHSVQHSPQDCNGETPLHLVLQSGMNSIAQRLVHAGASLDARDHMQQRPLHKLAKSHGSADWAVELAQTLAGETFARARQRDDLGRQPLHIAAANGGTRLITFLGEKCSDESCFIFGELDRSDDVGFTPFLLAIFYGHSECASELLRLGASASAKDIAGKTALHFACASGLVDTIPELVQHGAPLASASVKGETAIRSAAECGLPQCLEALLASASEQDIEQSFANEHTHSGGGVSPLMAAARTGSKECVRLLVQHQPFVRTVDCTDSSGNTALHHGAQFKDIVSILLRSGANPLIGNSHGDTPLELAQRSDCEDAVRLIEAEQNPNAVNHNGETRLLAAVKQCNTRAVQAVLQRGADANRKGEAERFPLHEAVASGQNELVQLLLHHGAGVDRVDDDHLSALHHAARNSHVDVLGILLGAGANVNKRDDVGQTPLHIAAQSGCSDAVRRVLDAGAASDRRDDNGRTPADCATTEHVAQMLSV
jgi:ankyrin repeat protein